MGRTRVSRAILTDTGATLPGILNSLRLLRSSAA